MYWGDSLPPRSMPMPFPSPLFSPSHPHCYLYLSPKLQGPFFCLFNRFPEPISSKDVFGLCNFLNELSLIVWKKINLLGWHWLTKLWRSQMHNSRTRHLYTVWYVRQPKSSFQPSPFIPPLQAILITACQPCTLKSMKRLTLGENAKRGQQFPLPLHPPFKQWQFEG